MRRFISLRLATACLLLFRLCATANKRISANRHSTGWSVIFLAGRGLLFLLLLPGPAPLWGYILGHARQDDGGDQEVDDQVDPVGIAELQGNLGPKRNDLQDE